MKKHSYYFLTTLTNYVLEKITVLILIFAVSISVYAQQPPLNQIEADRQQAQIEENRARNSAMNDIGKRGVRYRNSSLPKTKLSSVLKEKVKISEAEENEFATVLKDNKVNLIKVWNNTCGEKVFNAGDEKCLGKEDFLTASVYSFHLKDYKSFFSFFKIIENEFFTPNQDHSVQMLADLGEIALDKVNKNTKEAKEIWAFSDKSEADKVKKKVEKGFKLNEMSVSTKSKLFVNHTYLLRSIFVTVNYQPELRFPVYLTNDKLYSFQVLKENDGFITIAWKEVKM